MNASQILQSSMDAVYLTGKEHRILQVSYIKSLLDLVDQDHLVSVTVTVTWIVEALALLSTFFHGADMPFNKTVVLSVVQA